MSLQRRLATAVLPLPARKFLAQAYQAIVLKKAMREFLRDPDSSLAPGRPLLDRLSYGWGNRGWSASDGYLRACIEHALRHSGPFLECGSGLTTLLLGAIAQQRGDLLLSLEHHAEWAERVKKKLTEFGIHSVRLCVSPLEDHGDFSWYAPPTDGLPESFTLVICDGPPGDTNGGRYGLLPIMHSRLCPGCVIFLDDVHRASERKIAERWAKDFDLKLEIIGELRPFARLVVTGRRGDGTGGLT